MTSQFDNNGGGDQNVGQGEGAIGKQENATQEMCGDGNIFSGAGNVTVNQGLQLRLRTVVLGLVLLAAISGAALSLFAPAHLIGFTPRKKASTEGGNAPATVAGRDAAVSYNYNTNGVDPKLFAHYAGELAVTDAALTNFFRILDEQQVPRNDLDAKLREIAATHKELQTELAKVQSEDPEVLRLKDEAKQAIEAGHYANAKRLLKIIKEQPFATAYRIWIAAPPPPFREVTVAQGENGNPVGIADNPSPIQNAVALLAKVMRGEEVNLQEASPSKFLINSGTEIAILDSDNSSEQPSTGFTDPIGFTQFVNIKILEGPYKNRTGWIHASTIHHEQRKK